MAKKSGITWKTKQKHKKTWGEAVSRVDSHISGLESVEHYFGVKAAQFDSEALTGKSHEYLFWEGKGVNVKLFYLDIASELLFIASHWCEEAETYAKRNHPWQNRTGDAERGLYATIAGMEEDRIVMVLSHSVPYGVYLETAKKFGGILNSKYAIVRPTLQIYAPKLAQDLQGFLNRM